MSNQSNSLWWSYDPEDRSFKALPPGPMLLPTIGIFAFAALAGAINNRNKSPESILGKDRINSKSYQAAKARQDALIKKRIDAIYGLCDELTIAEAEELRRLQRPPWANGGEWSY